MPPGMPGNSSGGNALQGGPQTAGGVSFTLFGNPGSAATSGGMDWKLLAIIAALILLVVLILRKAGG